jgi:hypothetical protein
MTPSKSSRLRIATLGAILDKGWVDYFVPIRSLKSREAYTPMTRSLDETQFGRLRVVVGVCPYLLSLELTALLISQKGDGSCGRSR